MWFFIYLLKKRIYDDVIRNYTLIMLISVLLNYYLKVDYKGQGIAFGKRKNEGLVLLGLLLFGSGFSWGADPDPVFLSDRI